MELLDEHCIRQQLRQPANAWLRELRIFAETPSTNTALLELARTRDIDGVVYLAESQSAGRGRRGRNWLSPYARNIALSAGRSFHRTVSELGGLSLVIGLAVVEALEHCGVPDLALKWPNDVLLGGRKVGGILVELAAMVNPLPVVIGVGLNVGSRGEVEAGVDHPVADLAEAVPGISRNRLASALIDTLHDYCGRFESHGFGPLREAWLSRHALHRVGIDITIGERTVSGRVVGVATNGALIVDTGEGAREFVAGEVTVRPSR